MPLLDRYVLSRFLYNFFSSFAILMVIFIFQTIWLFIDDLAGKDLDIVIIGKFLFYLTPSLLDKVLPLTVLLSSILTFGTFAENYEFAAMKASGISLQKAMRSVVFFVSLLGIGTFFLANNVIPIAEQKIFNMRKNIAKVKPAAVIVEGVFSDIEGTDMNMKVSQKFGDNDQFLKDVIIHEKQNSINTTVIKAKEGELISSEDSDIIQLVLKDGYYYQETMPRSAKAKRKQPFARAHFETYIKNIDVSSLNNQNLEAESDITTDKMKNISRLRKDIDSLRTNNINQVNAFSKSVATRMGALVPKPKRNDSTIIKTVLKRKPGDTLMTTIAIDTPLVAVLPEWQRTQVFTNTKSNLGNILNSVKAKKKELNRRYEVFNRHILSLHKKFALAFSCIILFFVGAPLGAIIRKGGIGLPMVVAIVLFLAYYFLGVFAENYAKKGNMSPVLGAWFSTLVMFPFSILLTRRATADRGLMGFGNFFAIISGVFKKNKTDIPKSERIQNEIQSFYLDKESVEYQELINYNENRLLELLKKSEQFGYSDRYKNTAGRILLEKGYSLNELDKMGVLYNESYDELKSLELDFNKSSTICLSLYITAFILPIASTVLLPANKSLEIMAFALSIISFIGFYIYLFKSQLLYSKIFKILNKNELFNPWLIFIVGIVLYFIVYFKNKREIKRIISEYS